MKFIIFFSLLLSLVQCQWFNDENARNSSEDKSRVKRSNVLSLMGKSLHSKDFSCSGTPVSYYHEQQEKCIVDNSGCNRPNLLKKGYVLMDCPITASTSPTRCQRPVSEDCQKSSHVYTCELSISGDSISKYSKQCDNQKQALTKLYNEVCEHYQGSYREFLKAAICQQELSNETDSYTNNLSEKILKRLNNKSPCMINEDCKAVYWKSCSPIVFSESELDDTEALIEEYWQENFNLTGINKPESCTQTPLPVVKCHKNLCVQSKLKQQENTQNGDPILQENEFKKTEVENSMCESLNFSDYEDKCRDDLSYFSCQAKWDDLTVIYEGDECQSQKNVMKILYNQSCEEYMHTMNYSAFMSFVKCEQLQL